MSTYHRTSDDVATTWPPPGRARATTAPRRSRRCVRRLQPLLPGRRITVAGPVRDLVQARHQHGHLSQVQHVLPGPQPLTGRGQQQRQLAVTVRGPDVLDPLDLPTPTRDDLDRDRPGSGADRAHEPRDHSRKLARPNP